MTAGAAQKNAEILEREQEEWGIRLPDSVIYSEPEHCEVLPENWLTLQIFLSCETQWRPEGSSLDYGVVMQVAARVYGVPDGEPLREIMDGIKIIETEILTICNERRGKNGG